MLTSRWQTTRLVLLALTLGSIAAVLTKAMLSPKSNDASLVNAFEFPDSVPLSQWQFLDTKPLEISPKTSVAGRLYQYGQNSDRLKIETRYERYADGNISRLLHLYTPIKPATVLMTPKYQPGVGNYGLFEFQDHAQLSACFNGKGESSITDQQFTSNKYTHGFGIKRTLLWIAGQDDLFDGRCLWTLISTPITADNPAALEAAYQKLEKAWFDWYRWWKPKLAD